MFQWNPGAFKTVRDHKPTFQHYTSPRLPHQLQLFRRSRPNNSPFDLLKITEFLIISSILVGTFDQRLYSHPGWANHCKRNSKFANFLLELLSPVDITKDAKRRSDQGPSWEQGPVA